MKNVHTNNRKHSAAPASQEPGRKRRKREVYYTPEAITLKLLAAMGVERGVRFLDAYGKFIFSRP
ncbi:MAG: hypothetical protein ABSB35_15475 [Bryobacteraceae bacterium]|jgi:hypothetical protein